MWTTVKAFLKSCAKNGSCRKGDKLSGEILHGNISYTSDHGVCSLEDIEGKISFHQAVALVQSFPQLGRVWSVAVLPNLCTLLFLPLHSYILNILQTHAHITDRKSVV